MSATGLVFNIQRFSLHDGPGIRTTVFLKGCSMGCFWCHNPEGRRAFPEVQYDANRCIVCMDIKLIDAGRHREVTGASNERILVNAQRLALTGKPIIFRTPIMPTVNDTIEEFLKIASFVQYLTQLRTMSSDGNGASAAIQYELLPFHKLAADKYRSLGMAYQVADIDPPAQEKMLELANCAKSLGVEVKVR